MVLFYVAGAADSQEYAVCERLLDIMRMGLPDCQVHKSPVLPSEWPAYSRKLNESWGWKIASETTALVWTSNGRIVGDMKGFIAFAKQQYGVAHDLDDEQIKAYAAENLRLLHSNSERAAATSLSITSTRDAPLCV